MVWWESRDWSDVFWRWRREPWAKESKWPLGTEKDKEVGDPMSFPKECHSASMFTILVSATQRKYPCVSLSHQPCDISFSNNRKLILCLSLNMVWNFIWALNKVAKAKSVHINEGSFLISLPSRNIRCWFLDWAYINHSFLMKLLLIYSYMSAITFMHLYFTPNFFHMHKPFHDQTCFPIRFSLKPLSGSTC